MSKPRGKSRPPQSLPPLAPSEYDANDVALMYRDAVKGKRRLTSSVLSMEFVVFWLAIIVAIVQSHVRVAAALAVGGVLAIGCLAVAAMIWRSWAYKAGGVLQVLAILCGFVVPAMFVVGVIFAVLWTVAIRLGDSAFRRATVFEEYVGVTPTEAGSAGPQALGR